MKRNLKENNQGFTIVELMIATIVFGFVLLVASAGIIAIGKTYYKSITTSSTQNTARTLMDEVSRSLQFAKETVNISNYRMDNGVYCFGQDRYSFNIDEETGTKLRYDRMPLGTSCSYVDTGQELLGSNMRLLDFSVSGSGENYRVVIKVAYSAGDDLLTIYDNSGNPNGGIPIDLPTAAGAECKTGIAGSNFCGVSRLETTVTRRVD
jgi:prepilin-type N-terminal cleavage/methylation domain-containing protein